MLYLLPELYPNETVYSWFSRYHSLNGYLSYQNTFKELFNKRVIYPNIYYPVYLDYFISQLPYGNSFNLDYLVERHTILPLFKPFINNEKLIKTIEAMKKGPASYIKKYMGIESGGIFKHYSIKICTKCYSEDIDKYGEAYLHREHQIPGNNICIRHKNLLHKLDMEHINKHSFININHVKPDFKNIQIDKIILDEYFKLGKDINLGLNNSIKEYNLDMVKEKYFKKLETEGYGSIEGRINQKKLTRDFLNYYSKDFLNKLESYIDVEDKQNWIRLITSSTNKYIVHPIRHLLFMRFLFGGVQEFIDFEEKYIPFGEGPWTCLNPVAKHYGEGVINKCTIKKRYLAKEKSIPIGTFECECGFIYSRSGPDKCKEDREKIGRILNYGDTWEEKLRNLINNNQYSISKISKLMKCSNQTVIRYANKLDIIDMIDTNYNPATVDKSNNEEKEKINKYINSIKNYINTNREANRAKIQQEFKKEYRYLHKNARDLLVQILPRPNKCAPTINFNWNKKDVEMRGKVKEAIIKIKSKEVPKKITRACIASEVGYSGLRDKNTLLKLPLTSVIINDSLESSIEFKKRKKKKGN